MVEPDPAIVDPIAAHLLADIANADAVHGAVGLDVAQLHQEAVHSLQIDKCVVQASKQATGVPLCKAGSTEREANEGKVIYASIPCPRH